ncbi:MAG TPA: PTS system mannose/fructose/sorbose family transporter subunit IID [Gemmatimonadales bacterium]
MADLIRARPVLLRLLALQAAWSYERMQGIGIAWATEPALRDLFGQNEARYREALARAALFFNANPYLAAGAIGAELRAEADSVPGPQVERLRTALCGPLGALGDRLFWAGVVPALGAGAALAIAMGAGPWPVVAAVLVHNAIRLVLGRRLLRLGWNEGVRIGSAIGASAIPRLGDLAVAAAAFLCGVAVPVAGTWFLRQSAPGELVAVVVFLAAAILLRRLMGPRASPRRLTLIGGAVVIAWHLVNR